MPSFLKELANFVFGLIGVLLTLRFVLKLLAANPEAGFVSWVYATTQPLLNPFLQAFPTPELGEGFTLEFTTLFALFVYIMFGYLVQLLLDTVSSASK